MKIESEFIAKIYTGIYAPRKCKTLIIKVCINDDGTYTGFVNNEHIGIKFQECEKGDVLPYIMDCYIYGKGFNLKSLRGYCTLAEDENEANKKSL